MAEAIDVWFDHVVFAHDMHDPFLAKVETKLESYEVCEFGGTIDYLHLFHPRGDESVTAAFISDYKHGVGKLVTVEGNAQVMSYMSLVEEHYGVTEFYGSVAQPRSFARSRPIDIVKYDRETIVAFRETVKAAAKTQGYKSGDHCQFCWNTHKCPELYEISKQTAQVVFDEIAEGTDPYAAMIEVYERRSAVELLFQKIHEHLEQQLLQGKSVPGYKLVAREGNRRWTTAIDSLIETFSQKFQLTEEDLFDRKLKSPAQVEKLLPKAQRGEVNQHCDRPAAGYALAKEDDKRPAVSPVKATDVFTEISHG